MIINIYVDISDSNRTGPTRIGTTAFIFKPTKFWLRTIKKIDTRGC